MVIEGFTVAAVTETTYPRRHFFFIKSAGICKQIQGVWECAQIHHVRSVSLTFLDFSGAKGVTGIIIGNRLISVSIQTHH